MRKYDMGNAGDLLKHGVLAEFVHWQCQSGRSRKWQGAFGRCRTARCGRRRPASMPAGIAAAVWSPFKRLRTPAAGGFGC